MPAAADPYGFKYNATPGRLFQIIFLKRGAEYFPEEPRSNVHNEAARKNNSGRISVTIFPDRGKWSKRLFLNALK